VTVDERPSSQTKLQKNRAFINIYGRAEICHLCGVPALEHRDHAEGVVHRLYFEEVIGLPTSGKDVQTAIKQSGEFGVVASGQKLAGLVP
jgi:hypothetical protein